MKKEVKKSITPNENLPWLNIYLHVTLYFITHKGSQSSSHVKTMRDTLGVPEFPVCRKLNVFVR